MNIVIGIATVVAVILVGVVTLYFMGFKNWLVWAVTEAEEKFGGGTGKLKLTYAYNLAVNKFPIIAKVLPYSVFSLLIDKALVKMKEMIESNTKIAEVVNGVDTVVADATTKVGNFIGTVTNVPDISVTDASVTIKGSDK